MVDRITSDHIRDMDAYQQGIPSVTQIARTEAALVLLNNHIFPRVESNQNLVLAELHGAAAGIINSVDQNTLNITKPEDMVAVTEMLVSELKIWANFSGQPDELRQLLRNTCEAFDDLAYQKHMPRR